MKTKQQTEKYLKVKIKNETDSERLDMYEVCFDWLFCALNMGAFVKGLIQDVERLTISDEEILKEIQNFVYS